MTVDCFLDTNVLFYAAMARFASPAKYERARLLMAETNFAVSGQVLQEFFVNVTRKTGSPLSAKNALAWLDALRDRPCVPIDLAIVEAGAGISDRYQISYWDGAVIAAAQTINAPILYSEDLNDGQSYGSVRVLNPFRQN